jgi:hypothetical protein
VLIKNYLDHNIVYEFKSSEWESRDKAGAESYRFLFKEGQHFFWKAGEHLTY